VLGDWSDIEEALLLPRDWREFLPGFDQGQPRLLPSTATLRRRWGFEVTVGFRFGSSEIGEEQLLTETGSEREVWVAAGLLIPAGLFPTQSTGSQLTYRGVSSAVAAVGLDVVGVPPTTLPASPSILAVDAPGETALTRPWMLRSTGMAGVAEPVVEVTVGSAL
jgi:hypothetical protein